MWKNGDVINLNGSVSFMSFEEANEFRRVAKYCFRLKMLSVEQIFIDEGVSAWTVEVVKNDVSPFFINMLHTISEKHLIRGTLTYMFNERFEVGVLRNGDLIRLQPKELITYAVEKLGYVEEEITSSDYDRIKQEWFFKVWKL